MSVQHEPGSRAHNCPHLRNFLTAASASTDEAACTRQPRPGHGCHLHAVSSSYVVVTHISRTSLDLNLDLGELIVIITGKAEAFIYKSPSYNDVRQWDMLGGKLSQLNDKV